MEPALQKAAGAGVEAARMLAGVVGGEPGRGERSRRLINSMGQDLATQLKSAVASNESSDAANTLSRVFRLWRTDEAERWVRAIVIAEYHDALAAALAGGGVEGVVGVAGGAACDQCPAGRTWNPSSAPPDGTRVPPVHLDCACTFEPV